MNTEQVMRKLRYFSASKDGCQFDLFRCFASPCIVENNGNKFRSDNNNQNKNKTNIKKMNKNFKQQFSKSSLACHALL